MSLWTFLSGHRAPRANPRRYVGHLGAGVLPVAASTGRLLVGLRSRRVREPGTWGTWGGALDDDAARARGEELSVLEGALAEFTEESGWDGEFLATAPLATFEDPDAGFAFYNFLLVLPEEFTPPLARLDGEVDETRWVPWGAWPEPLHFGLQFLLDDPRTGRAVRQQLAAHAPRGLRHAAR